jgi:hypothetical protein
MSDPIAVVGGLGALGFASAALWLALSRGSARVALARAEGRERALSAALEAMAQREAQARAELDGMEVTLEAYDQIIAGAGGSSDPRDLLARIGVLSRAEDGDDPGSSGVPAEAGAATHTAPGAELFGPEYRLLESRARAHGGAVGDSSADVDDRGDQ